MPKSRPRVPGEIPSVPSARARLRVNRRPDRGADETPLLVELKAAKLADRIAREIESWPPLTDEQRDRLATLLRPAGTTRVRRPKGDR